MNRKSRRRSFILALVLSASAAACGDSNGGAPPAATATPTTTPQVAGAVDGLVVINRSVTSGGDDALGAPPQLWKQTPESLSFDRALSSADWAVEGAGQHGTTGPDGQFEIGGLSSGQYTLSVTKTLDGNLASMNIPFSVGPNGQADVVAEVAWGLVRSVSKYMQDGVAIEAIVGPYGNWLTLRDGRISGFGEGGRSFSDPDGDGKFDISPCNAPPIRCLVPEPNPTCGSDATCPPWRCLPAEQVSPPCNSDGTCPNSSDQCVCVPSCPTCNDCPAQVCVPECAPVDITAVTITSAPSQLVAGQQGSATAAVQLSDGSQFDVTYLVEWKSSDPTVASIDSWGTVAGVAVGTTELTATLGTLTSDPSPLEVVERPTLQRIDIQNVSCFYPGGVPADFGKAPPQAMPPASDMPMLPSCGQVVQVGKTLQFRAVGEFENGYYQDITDEAQWQLAPPEVGDVVAGTFTALQAGTTNLTATLGSVVSDPTEIRVVTEPTVVALSIDTDNVVVLTNGPPMQGGVAVPCMAVGPGVGPCCCPGPMMGAACNCGYATTVLTGGQLQFHAHAQYDTGEWRDVTNEVTWQSSNPAACSIDSNGLMTAVAAGDADIDAVLGAVTSNSVSVHVVDHATLQSLYISQDGTDRVVAKGDQLFFKAQGYYDVGFGRDVTAEATWHSSDESIGGFATPGVFTGRGAGTVQVWAELDGQTSQQIAIEVYETSELNYCDPANINRAVWSDDFNRVTLESDCASYTQPGVVALRYTVTQLQFRGGTFAPCLDLYVASANGKIRTIRDQGCGAPFLAGNAPNLDQELLKYQLRAFWDLKDDTGAPVPPGTYTIFGRFYLYYDPVVSIDVIVLAPGQPTPTPKPSVLQSPTPTPAWPVKCTPPPCPPGGVLYCPDSCPGGCGYRCMVPTPTPTAGPPASVEAGTASGLPGDVATFTVSLDTAGQVIGATQNDLGFDASTAIPPNADGNPDCVVNPAIEKEAAAFAFLPPGCAGAACTQIRAVVFSMSNLLPIPDGSVLYTCKVNIAGDAEPGVHTLTVSNVVASSPKGDPLPATGTDGEIVVVSPVPVD